MTQAIKSKRTFRHIAVVSATLLLMLLAVEIGLRLFWQPPVSVNYYRTDDAFHHRGRPNVVIHHVLHDGQKIEVATNSLGLRDVEYGPKPDGVTRILVLGDSFTEAGTAPFPFCSTKILERKLNDKFGAGRFQVINAGQVSYSPLLEYLLLSRVLINLAPDLVLLNLDMTDVQDDQLYTRIAQFDEQGLPVAVPFRPIPTVVAKEPPKKNNLLGYFYYKVFIVKFIAERTHYFEKSFTKQTIVKGEIDTDRLGATRDELTGWEPYYEQTGAYLRLIRDYLAARDIPLVVFVYPHGHQVAAREWAQGRELYAFAKDRVYRGTFLPFLETYCPQHDLDCRFLHQEFQQYTGDDLLYLPFNGHFTRAGEAMLALLQFDILIGGDYAAIIH